MPAPRTPTRYRDVLALLKALARNPEVTADGLRAVLAGNIGEGYTQADIERTRIVAAELGWDLAAVDERGLEPVETDGDTFRAEISRLHRTIAQLRAQVKSLEHGNQVGREKSQLRADARRRQLDAAGLDSIDAVFERLELYRAHIERHGECHAAECGDDPSMDRDARQAFLKAHTEVCTCGTDRVYALVVRRLPATV